MAIGELRDAVIISVADIIFLDVKTKKEIGRAVTSTTSGVTSTMDSTQVRGGFLDPLIYNFLHSRTFELKTTSATFKMAYLAFQAGGVIEGGNEQSYITSECHTAVDGAITLDKTPVGFVHVTLPSGVEVDVESKGIVTINVGSGVNGIVNCAYFTEAYGKTIRIDTAQQPMIVEAVMLIRAKLTDGTNRIIQITIPKFQFDGAIEFSLTSDGVSTQDISGTALASGTGCGAPVYAIVTEFTEGETNAIPQAIFANPSVYTIAVDEEVSANIWGVGQALNANEAIPYGDTLVFASLDATKASVTSATGVIKGVAAGTTNISVVYTPVTGVSFNTVLSVTVTV